MALAPIHPRYLTVQAPHTMYEGSSYAPVVGSNIYNPVYNNSFNWSSPDLSLYGGLSPIGGYGSFSPYVYGPGYGGYVPAYGSMGAYGEPWECYGPDDLEDAFRMGRISAPQYTQYILMLGDHGRRRSRWPFLRRRDRDRFMMGPGIGYGGLGRRGWIDGLGLIPGSRGIGWDWR